VKQHLTGEFNADGIRSGGTTREQAEFAARHPQVAELQIRGAAVLKEVGQAGLVGAAVGGGLQGAFSAIHQGMRLSQGETTATEAIVITIKATTSGAVRGGVVAGGSRVIAIIANEVGVGRILGEMGPGAMANAIFEAGLSTHRFARGEIGHDAYRQELGGAALRATASTYCGMAGQLLIPIAVVGAAVGAISGYVAAAVLVESGVLGLGSNNIVTIAEERQAAIERECAAAILEMRRCQQELQQLEDSYGEGFRQTFNPCSRNSGSISKQACTATALSAWYGSPMPSAMLCPGAALRSSTPSWSMRSWSLFSDNPLFRRDPRRKQLPPHWPLIPVGQLGGIRHPKANHRIAPARIGLTFIQQCQQIDVCHW